MSTDTLTLARAYHDAWTSKDFATAVGLLSERLQVEVPINAYPTTESFAQALVHVGSRVRRVDLLSEMSAANEAMLLYDMDVDGLGTMRVVEHFTVEGRKIVRLRQIHDTALVRNSEFASADTHPV